MKACICPHGSPSGPAKFASISDEDLSQIQSIRPVIGELAYKNFLEPHGRSVYVITHCAVQGVLAALCERLIKDWSFKEDEHELLSRVYDSMRSVFGMCSSMIAYHMIYRWVLYTVVDSMSTGTWRCLTRAQTKTPLYHDQKESNLHSFAREIAKVLLLDGYPCTLDDAEENILDFFAEDLYDLYDCCFRLDRVANEGVYATDIILYRPQPGDAYEDELMYDMATSTEVYHDPNLGITKDSRCDIAFACHLGLLKIGTVPNNYEGVYMEEVLLKAAVQLSGLFSAA